MSNLNDIIGQKFGKLKVIKYNGYEYRGKGKYHFYLCKCDCGNKTVAARALLLNGHKTSCGCASNKIKDLNDIVNQKFGKLTVLKYLYSKRLYGKYMNHFYRCKCDCGNEITTTRRRLIDKKDPQTSCGCNNKIKMIKIENLNDIINQKFGKLKVIKYVYSEKDKHNNLRHMYLCKCDCGNEITAERNQLMSGRKKSCGCIRMVQNLNDIVNKKFGMLKVIKYAYSEKDEHNHLRHMYLCKCDCGNEILVERNELRINSNSSSKGRISCGCAGKIHDLNDIVGQKFGKLTVIDYDYYNPKQFKHYYKCRCDCGNVISIERNCLKNGHTKSCGCGKGDLFTIKHNMSHTRFYNIWYHMKYRCYNPSYNEYDQYGGRGIKVCDRWKDSFENFRDDMYESYLEHAAKYGEENTSIDRINRDGDYCPENCRWATYKVQNNNMSTNHMITYNNETLTLSQFAEKYSTPTLTTGQIIYRINNGWELDRAICDVLYYYQGKPVICPIIFKDKKE